MRERLKELWQQARAPASSGLSRLASLLRPLGGWTARVAAGAGRAVGRGLAAAFSWNGGLLALRWVVVLTVVAGLGFFLGRARPDMVPAMPWQVGPPQQTAGDMGQAPGDGGPVSGPAGPAEAPLEGALSPTAAPEEEPVQALAAAAGTEESSTRPSPPSPGPAAAAPAAVPDVDLSAMVAPAVGSLGQGFAWVRETSTRAWRLHDGIDLVTPPRQPVTAALPGRVTQVARASGGGFAVWIDHGDGWTTGYQALSETFVVEGQQVAQGQAVGRAGRLEDGLSTGVHFSVHHQGRPEDPTRLLPALTR